MDRKVTKFNAVYLLTDGQGVDIDGWQWQGDTVSNNACAGSLYVHPAIAVLLNPLYEKFETEDLTIWRGIAKDTAPDGIGRFKANGLALVDRVPAPLIPDARRLAFALLCVRRVYPEKWFLDMTDEWLFGAELPLDKFERNFSLAKEILNEHPHAPGLAQMIRSAVEMSKWLCLGICTDEDGIDFAEQAAGCIELAAYAGIESGRHLDLVEIWGELERYTGVVVPV
ncbi:MAG TPA: hypothetical protein PLR60_05625 [Syntrophorhabdaceae bacterium]|nr:hypothetical protein [Syntrophorhabdaceae bacterium]